MYAILKLKEIPESCIDCPCEYDSIFCQAIEDPDARDFLYQQEQYGIDTWETRLPECPLEIYEEKQE